MCVEIFLPDDEARVLTLNLSQAETLLNDLPVPVQALYIFDAIYLFISDCEHDYLLICYFSHTWYNTIALFLILFLRLIDLL